MNILITGAKGMVGTALVNNLKNIRDNKNRTRPNISVENIYEYDLDSTPEELVTIFKALSDPIRLQIMNYVIKKPSTTQSLAQILSLSNSSVSRHLQILKEANLLKTKKSKKFVLYEPTELVTQLMPDFYQFFKN